MIGNGDGTRQGSGSDINRGELMEIARILDTDAIEAERRIRDFLNRNPGEMNATYLLGIACRLQERFEESITTLQAVIDAAPDFPAAHQELGVTLHSIGYLDEAKTRLREALRLEPRLAMAWRTLGDVLSELGDNPGAREAHQKYQEISAQQVGSSQAGMAPAVQEAQQALTRGDLQRADQLCRNQLKDNPNDAWALRTLAEVGVQLGAFGDAQSIIEVCLGIDPEFHDARRLYANILQYRNEYPKALEQLDILADKQPGNPNTGAIRAKVLAELGDYETALDIYHDLTQFFKKNAVIFTEYGHTLRAVGRQDEAIQAYRDGLAIDPKRGELWFSLANLKTFQFTAEEVETLKSLLQSGDLSSANASHIGFSLGKAEEDLENFNAAFAAFDIGNKSKRSFLTYEADETSRIVQATKAAFTPDYFAQHVNSGCQDLDPIFILGLPRTGSTLVEQILASHSKVDGTMELPDIMALTRRIGGSTGPHVPSAYPGNIGSLSDDDLKAQGEAYLTRAAPRRAGAPFFIDKMPENFLHLGFIKATLPNAKVIDTRRHPMSTCYSIWKQAFTFTRDYAYDFRDIGRYYCDYIDLMDHWNSVLPGFVYQVDYESLVNNSEAEIRKLLDYCELDFEEACLNAHQTQRTVRTASSEQVRTPIYKDALEQWRNYEDKLDGLREALAPLSDRYALD